MTHRESREGSLDPHAEPRKLEVGPIIGPASVVGPLTRNERFFNRDCYSDETNILEHVKTAHGIKRIAPVATANWLPPYRYLHNWFQEVESKCTRIPAYKFSDAIGQYVFLTEEFVKALSRRLILLSQNRPILECYAGTGLLSWWLAKYGVNIIPTDIDVSKENHWTKLPSLDTVIQMDANTAVELFRPEIILCSWVPYGDRLPNKLIAKSFVKGMVVIGEGNGGCCGHDSFYEHTEEEDWSEMWAYSVCRTDSDFQPDGSIFLKHQAVGMYTAKKKRPSVHVPLLERIHAPKVQEKHPKKRAHFSQMAGSKAWRCHHCQKHRNSLRSIQRHYSKKHSLRNTMKHLRRLTVATETFTKKHFGVKA